MKATTIVFVFATVLMHLAYTAPARKIMIVDPTKVPAKVLPALYARIESLVANGDSNGLKELARKVREMLIYKERLDKCIAKLGSKSICEGNVGFYIWAQMLAKDIMNGNDH